jgi:hypothetical protein
LITISGQLTYKDGQPVPEEEVRFDPRDDTKYERVEVETDKNGNFRFEIPLGAKGELKAKTNIWAIQFEKCTQALALRKSRTGRDADIQSNVVNIDGQSLQRQIKLVYPLTCRYATLKTRNENGPEGCRRANDIEVSLGSEPL